jgi:ribulose-phosphate 3-epimerase
MLVIPAINCKDYETALSRIKTADKILGIDYRWVHIDVVDGLFAPVVTWGSPEDLKRLHSQFSSFKFEIHLMVENHELAAAQWLDAGAKRLVIHVESAGDAEKTRLLAESRGAEAVLSGGPAVSAEKIISSGPNFKFFQVLAVNPGFAGQQFGADAADKISFLRKHMPNAKIELDGGVNPKVAKAAQAAGADVAVSASYIFDALDPKAAYEELRNI